jgi:hypothetical protein
MRMDRRLLLKKLGLGSLILGSSSTSIDRFVLPAMAEAEINFHFLSMSVAGPEGTPKSPRHHNFMSGDGKFDPSRPGSRVVGGGSYVHWLFPGRNPLPGEPPLPVVASGTWRAARLVSYKEIGRFGVQAGGTLEMVADIFQVIPSKAVFRGARLTLICNLPPAGLFTGHEEGYELSLPGTDYSPGGTLGTFHPIVPPTGLTAFSTVPIL